MLNNEEKLRNLRAWPGLHHWYPEISNCFVLKQECMQKELIECLETGIRHVMITLKLLCTTVFTVYWTVNNREKSSFTVLLMCIALRG